MSGQGSGCNLFRDPLAGSPGGVPWRFPKVVFFFPLAKVLPRLTKREIANLHPKKGVTDKPKSAEKCLNVAVWVGNV